MDKLAKEHPTETMCLKYRLLEGHPLPTLAEVEKEIAELDSSDLKSVFQRKYRSILNS
jgi:hypothetical protein